MTHDELVEKVARALAYLNDDDDGDWESYYSDAKAAITAVREALQEPTVLSDMRRAAIVAQGLTHNESLDYRELMDEAIKAAIAASPLASNALRERGRE